MTTPTPLPADVYRLSQKDFDAISGNPWAYWLSSKIRDIFRTSPTFDTIAYRPFPGNTSNNFRFVRFAWEIVDHQRWILYSKGGGYRKWYGNYFFVVDWLPVTRRFYKEDHVARITDESSWYKEGITYSAISSTIFYARYIPPGGVYDRKGPAILLRKKSDIRAFVGLLNSKFVGWVLGLLNPTISIQAGDIDRIPFCEIENSKKLSLFAKDCIFTEIYKSSKDEWNSNFVVPWALQYGLDENSKLDVRLQELQSQIDDEVFALYDISPEDRAAIEAELAGGALREDEETDESPKSEDEEETPQSMSREELAARWVSYALGVVLGRFIAGDEGRKTKDQGQKNLGSAVYYRGDFAIGSLPTPDEAEFNELVGTPNQFAYIGTGGGRHVFSAQVERALNALAFEDGIAVLEAGHPRDLVARVEKALALMLGESGFEEVTAVLNDERKTADHGQSSSILRQFLQKDYFTKWHFKWYRKRPVYWPIQSAKRSYGFVLFHEKITRDTFYAIQREPYLDTKCNAVALKIGDLEAELPGKQGAVRKKAEKDLDDLRKLAAELAEFAKELESITMGGYNHEPAWVDDGVILRLAPLWKIIPLWKSEPKKYWERLEAGDFDWSRIAMNYWPERVNGKCKTNKSYAIAHGHEEWYNGK